MKLYIIRHGETEWNKQKKLQGQSDVPLNDYGRELARITAKALEDVQFDMAYTSPLSRAYETAQIILGERNVQITTDARLMEISFGKAEGQRSDSLGEDFKNFFFAPDQFIPLENGESYADVMARAGDFFENVLEPLRCTDKTVLIVAHGAMNKALMNYFKKVSIKDFWEGEFQCNCCVNIYEFREDDFDIIEEAKVYYEGATTNYLDDK
ncbi:MAG: histidine phosphatase family protein [Lachnospiraceae bacterium]